MQVLTIDRIRRALQNPSKDKKGLAEALRIPASSITALLAEGPDQKPRGIKVSEVPTIVEYLELDRVPLMGLVGAGGEVEPFFEQSPPEGWEMIQLPFMVEEGLIALRVMGDSMPQRYDEGDLLIVWKTQRNSVESLYGSEAAVLTSEGRRFVKRIMPSSKAGTVDLHSFDGRLPLVGIRLDWISEIKYTFRRSQLEWSRKPEPRDNRGGPRSRGR